MLPLRPRQQRKPPAWASRDQVQLPRRQQLLRRSRTNRTLPGDRDVAPVEGCVGRAFGLDLAAGATLEVASVYGRETPRIEIRSGVVPRRGGLGMQRVCQRLRLALLQRCG